MNYILYLASACTIISLQFVYGGRLPAKYADQFELREGNCSSAVLGDLVFQDHVHKTRIPFTTRDATSSWHGDQTIYCILALSQKEESKGSTVSITDGGINHSYLTLEMHSKTNHGLEYNIQVFGKLK